MVFVILGATSQIFHGLGNTDRGWIVMGRIGYCAVAHFTRYGTQRGETVSIAGVCVLMNRKEMEL